MSNTTVVALRKLHLKNIVVTKYREYDKLMNRRIGITLELRKNAMTRDQMLEALFHTLFTFFSGEGHESALKLCLKLTNASVVTLLDRRLDDMNESREL